MHKNPVGAVEYRSIQTLRGAAAVLVALMHLLFFYTDSMKYIGGAPPHMATFFYFKGWGGVGLQIFFVISGFIMAYLNSIKETVSFGAYMGRRITRIVPLYWLATLVWAYLLFPPGTYPLPRVLESLFFVVRPDNSTVLGPGWSLNFEMFFYVLFGFVTLVCRVSYLWVGIAFVAMNALGQLTGFFAFSLLSDPVVWNFVAGIVIFQIHRLPAIAKESRAIFWAGVLLLASSIFWHIADKSYGPRQFLPWGVPSMLIVLGATAMEMSGQGRALFGSRIMLALGNASYALYLVHSMCFVGVSWVLLYWLKVQHYVGPDGAVLVYLGVCCAISLVVHRLIERPLTRLVRRSARVCGGVLRASPKAASEAISESGAHADGR
jgi:exopolysaccharide production protein ExoZ